MGRYVIWIAFVVTLQISTVLCRNPFQEYFYNKYHHKGHSTTVSISSSTSDTSSEEITASSVSDYASLEDVLHSSSGGTLLKDLLHSSTVDLGTTVEGNLTILQYGYSYNERHQRNTWLIIGFVLLVLFAVSLVICSCCCAKSWRKELKGVVLSDNNRETTRTPMQQLPYFSATHSLYQCSGLPLMQCHTPDTQPPPYEAPSFEVPSFFCQHTGQTLMQPYYIPLSPPPPYEAPPFEAPLHGAPPTGYQVTNNEN